MNLTHHLILFKYLLRQFGFDTFDRLKERFSAVLPNYDATGHSYYANALLTCKRKIPDKDILHYDDLIRGYEEKLLKNRSELYLSFKYFQYFALLFTEYYLDRYVNNLEYLLQELNAFKASQKEFEQIDDFAKSDLKKLAYWMATGSGKTLIMHVNFWQLTRYFKNWENIILVTPNEGLSRQHYEEFYKSGIKAKRYSGSEETLKTREGEILIIEITKLVKDKEGEGVSVDVDYFSESRNLVFIDEGHKGQRSEEKVWKQLREYLTRGDDSFSVEYSATFGQIIGRGNRDLLHEYGKAIIFDYSYRHFYLDGYGKDFNVFNINAETSYSDEQIDLVLTGSLMGFYEQLIMFESYGEKLKKYNIESPLWVFVGSKVVGKKTPSSLTMQDKKNISDVALVLKYIKNILSNPQFLQDVINKILTGDSGLQDNHGDDIFKNHFLHLRGNRVTGQNIIEKVFSGTGELEAWQIKQADGEIGLKTSLSKNYFGVINIGDVPAFSKKLIEDFGSNFEIKSDSFSTSLFHNISHTHSNVNILIGSKKFIEGWNSWRVSSMGLMNMGKNEGTQIIQLFGRGIRLKGRSLSLKREENSASYYIRALQTLSIFGLNAEYMNNFLNAIEKEITQYREFKIPIKLNREEKWQKKILTLKKDRSANFRKLIIQLEINEKILKRIQIDLRPKISVTRGTTEYVAETDAEYGAHLNILKKFYPFIDFEKLYLDVLKYKTIRGYTNLILVKDAIEQIINNDFYQISTLPDQFGVEDALNSKIQNIAFAVVRDYVDKFYSNREKDYVTRNLTCDYLTDSEYNQLFPDEEQIIVQVPESKIDTLEIIFEDLEKFYHETVEEIPTIHFDRHLYSPLAVYKKGKEDIKTIPVKLNQGETKFISHLREYLISQQDKIQNKEIFVLRNLSMRGLGFFIESSSFFPDFIIWIVGENRQDIFFIDPKGILMLGNFGHEKIVFCNETIKDLEKALRTKINAKKDKIEINLKAFILSFSKFEDIKDSWGTGMALIEDFEKNNILFFDEAKKYLLRMFDDILKKGFQIEKS